MVLRQRLRGKLAAVRGNIFERLRTLVAAAISDGISLGLDEQVVVDAAKWAFDTLVKPYDIPFLPENIESKLEDRLWQVAEALIRRAIKE